MSNKMLIILSPPRSFSSVVSTMIGQHPQLYCFPELHLFVADSVAAILDREAKKQNYAGPPGVLRTLAELHYGSQTITTVLKAGAWVVERRDWTTKELIDHMCELVAPRIAVEKSPVTCAKPAYLERTYNYYPDAFYLHLTRHPLATRNSMDEFFNKRQQVGAQTGNKRSMEMDPLLIWYRMHMNIIDFAAKLPLSQAMRVKGEDLLSEPDRYLPQIAEWLGVRTDRDAIDAMKHPENSPYAHVGPARARGGNDGKFMRSPALRAGRVREPSLRDAVAKGAIAWFSEEGRAMYREVGLEPRPAEEVAAEINGVAQRMGYL